jgi:hypothetical protein
MKIVPYQNARSIAELTQQIYGLKPGDPRAQAAEKALLAANPSFAAGLAHIAQGAPVVAPALSGTSQPVVNDPISNNIQSLLQGLGDAVAAVQAQATGAAANAATTDGVKLLSEDVKKFLSRHFE